MIYTRKLLTTAETKSIRESLSEAQWIDGKASTQHNITKLKNNLEMVAGTPTFNKIERIVNEALSRDIEYTLRLVEFRNSAIIVSKTPVGGYYNPHQDGWQVDYSTTVFLSEPSEYEGGALRVGNESYRLPAGHAISYPTGLVHQVEPVTSGSRDVIVFWSESVFQDSTLRAAASDISRAIELLGMEVPMSIDEANENPSFLLCNALQELKRRYGRMW